MHETFLDILRAINSKVDMALAQQAALKEAQDRNTEAWRENTKSLEEHMRRTENVENRVDPIEKLMFMLQGFAKGVVVLGGCLAVVKGGYELWKLIYSVAGIR